MRSVRTHFFLALVAFLAVVATLQASHAKSRRGEDPVKLLAEADRARGGLVKGVVWDIDVESQEEGEQSVRSFKVKAKGVNASVEATAPARNKDEVFLFNDRTMWFFRPGLRKPVSISARQKLSGQAANGDIASTNYSKDYEGEITGEDTIGGEKCWVLELKAKSKSQTYDRIKYWIQKKGKLGVKAEFKTVSGETFKIGTFEYGNKISTSGGSFPFVSKMTIVDAKFPQNKSAITYKSPREQAIADSQFNVNNLAR
ncbi:MAG TPA: outer membrane lipoprotein-sorting protein [Bdellovibrionota bacterium]|nr:outer membrane lipoprotein-sorting protein [Bdellovibrionota bacterium]